MESDLQTKPLFKDIHKLIVTFQLALKLDKFNSLGH